MSKYRRPLTEVELLDLISRDDVSDIGELSDEEKYGWIDDDEVVESVRDVIEIEKATAEIENELDDEEENTDDIQNSGETMPHNITRNEETEQEKIRKFNEEHELTEKKSIKWLQNIIFQSPLIRWFRPEVLYSTDNLPSPIDFFVQYIPNDIVSQMTEMTNLFSVQQNVARFPPVTSAEMKTFLGIHVIMGNLNFPRARMYWHPFIGIPLVKDNMSYNRFCKLRGTLHLVDITARGDNNMDRFWKVRAIYDSIRQRCRTLPLETNLCVDEQIVPFKGQINVKQYIKNKPKKWGIKIYILAGQSGLIYDFLIYQGSTTEIKKEYLQFGSGAGTVMQLSERISEPNHGLYYDNYFSSYSLLQYLRSRNIFATGTIRLNRFCNPKLSSDKVLKKKGRGACEESISTDGIVVTKWYDNKPVLLGSNFVGIGEKDICRRWDKKQKAYVNVERPEAVRLYNTNMGGVDKVDFLLSLYRSYIRSRKWTIRMITHAIDLALINAWIEYKQQAELLGVDKKRILDLLGFRQSVGESLIYSKNSTKRGRPSAQEEQPAQKKKKVEIKPLNEMRFDGVDHFPQYDDKKDNTRCKLEECKGKTHIYCKKCNVHLCILKDRNCFTIFHTK